MNTNRYVVVALAAEAALLALGLAYLVGSQRPGRFELVSLGSPAEQGKVLLDTSSGAVYRFELKPGSTDSQPSTNWKRLTDPV